MDIEWKTLFSESKKIVREKWFLKYLATVMLVTSVAIPMVLFGVLYYVFYTYTDFRVIETTDPFEEFPEEWTISKGKIINTARENYVFPDDPLEYQVTITNPKNEDRQLTLYLKVFKGGKLVDDKVLERSWWVKSNSKVTTDFPIFLKDEGTYRLEFRFVFDMDKPCCVRPNHTFPEETIQVQSLSNKLLADANYNSFWGYVTIFVVAVSGNVGTIFYLRKQHKQTKKQLEYTRQELESRLRADLYVIIGETDLKKSDVTIEGKLITQFKGKVIFSLKNIGTMPARNIRVYFKDPTSSMDLSQIIRDEKVIKNSHMPVTGIIPPDKISPHIRHDTILDQSGVYQIAIWVEYDYADVKNMEFIQIVEVNAQSNSLPILYDKTEIDKERRSQKHIGF